MSQQVGHVKLMDYEDYCSNMKSNIEYIDMIRWKIYLNSNDGWFLGLGFWRFAVLPGKPWRVSDIRSILNLVMGLFGDTRL